MPTETEIIKAFITELQYMREDCNLIIQTLLTDKEIKYNNIALLEAHISRMKEIAGRKITD